MSERSDADRLARKLLDESMADPDDDLRMLSRQLLRRGEVITRLEKALSDQQDPTLDMINANRDIILSKHEEAVRLIRGCLKVIDGDKSGMRFVTESQCKRIGAIIDALNQFHPMHGESWCGWSSE